MKFNFTFLLLVVLLSIGCRKNETSWKSDWVVPLIKDSLVIKDYVNDSTLAINNDQSIQIIAERSLVNLDLTSLVEIPDTSIEQTFTINFPSLTLNPGTSFVDEIKEHEFDLGETALTNVRVENGKANIRIENPIASTGVFHVTLPGVVKNGSVFTHTENVPGGTMANPGIANLELDLTGYSIDMTGETGQLYNLLQSKMRISTDPNGSAITVTNQDVFKTIVSFENLTFDYAKGYFGNIIFSDTNTVDVDFLKNIVGGAINLEDLNLELIIQNGIKVRAKGEISQFESVNYNGTSVSLDHPYFNQEFIINPATGSWSSISPSELNFLFDQSTGNLEAFLENIGSQYNLGYAIELNPLGNTSSGNDVLYPESRLGIELKADFPLKLGADSLTLRDTFDIDFKNDSKLLRVESGDLILQTTNTFPFGAEVKLELIDEYGAFLAKINSTGSVLPAQTNVSNDAHEPIENELRFNVEESIVNVLPETKSIVVTATFSSTTFNNNKVYANAALHLLLMSELKLKSQL
ncbi:hypothetical protein [Brumimicrobium aurantiacum]|uniref:Uncharacterized protein n=1 Tax=Brumimicrobium aurantiacum TaxID=1737063 RepID=A0A3E1EYP5_9FLAO|nr:hypothetical protein [Brumimicrobium aurantiacum]RFC54674.1 hypothetical protein DXU93_06710 [Brumimicrobium aurantiacum]